MPRVRRFDPRAEHGSTAVDFLMTDLADGFNEDSTFQVDAQWPDYPKELIKMQFTIESGIPVPRTRHNLPSEFCSDLRKTIQELEVGQSFVVPLSAREQATAAKLQMTAMTFARTLKPKHFISRKVFGEDKKESGIRIWRLE